MLACYSIFTQWKTFVCALIVIVWLGVLWFIQFNPDPYSPVSVHFNKTLTPASLQPYTGALTVFLFVYAVYLNYTMGQYKDIVRKYTELMGRCIMLAADVKLIPPLNQVSKELAELHIYCSTLPTYIAHLLRYDDQYSFHVGFFSFLWWNKDLHEVSQNKLFTKHVIEKHPKLVESIKSKRWATEYQHGCELLVALDRAAHLQSAPDIENQLISLTSKMIDPQVSGKALHLTGSKWSELHKSLRDIFNMMLEIMGFNDTHRPDYIYRLTVVLFFINQGLAVFYGWMMLGWTIGTLFIIVHFIVFIWLVDGSRTITPVFHPHTEGYSIMMNKTFDAETQINEILQISSHR
jgi:hypothetical protein